MGDATFTALVGGEATIRAAGFGAGRETCGIRANLPVFALAGFALLARDPAALTLCAAGLATLRAAGRFGAAFLAVGFLVFEAFFAGISFSAPGQIERRIIAPAFLRSSTTIFGSARITYSGQGHRRRGLPVAALAFRHDSRVDAAAHVESSREAQESRVEGARQAIHDLIRHRFVKCAAIPE